MRAIVLAMLLAGAAIAEPVAPACTAGRVATCLYPMPHEKGPTRYAAAAVRGGLGTSGDHGA